LALYASLAIMNTPPCTCIVLLGVVDPLPTSVRDAPPAATVFVIVTVFAEVDVSVTDNSPLIVSFPLTVRAPVVALFVVLMVPADAPSRVNPAV